MLTIGDLSKELSATCPTPVPSWKVRRVVDSLEPNIQRAGQYRLVPRSLIPAIVQELERTGWFKLEAAGK